MSCSWSLYIVVYWTYRISFIVSFINTLMLILQKQTECINLQYSVWVAITEIVYFIILTRRCFRFCLKLYHCLSSQAVRISRIIGSQWVLRGKSRVWLVRLCPSLWLQLDQSKEKVSIARVLFHFVKGVRSLNSSSAITLIEHIFHQICKITNNKDFHSKWKCPQTDLVYELRLIS